MPPLRLQEKQPKPQPHTPFPHEALKEEKKQQLLLPHQYHICLRTDACTMRCERWAWLAGGPLSRTPWRTPLFTVRGKPAGTALSSAAGFPLTAAAGRLAQGVDGLISCPCSLWTAASTACCSGRRGPLRRRPFRPCPSPRACGSGAAAPSCRPSCLPSLAAGHRLGVDLARVFSTVGSLNVKASARAKRDRSSAPA